jgi:uncharacterized protein
MTKLRVSAGAFALAVVLPLAFCGCKNRLLFYPQKQLVATPAAAGLAYEDLYIRTDDGVSLNAWWVPAPSARGTVLFCHGNGGNISYLIGTIGIFNSLKLNVLVFDYRGYGRSGGAPSEEGTYLDAKAVWDHLTVARKIDAGSIVVIGRSLGGPIAAWLCRDRKPAALVMESTFTKAADVADYHYRIAPGRLIFCDTYDAAAHLSRARCPVLVVHSPEDEIIPYQLGKKLFQIAPGIRRLLVIHGPHNEGFMRSLDSYAAGLDHFVSACLPAR